MALTEQERQWWRREILHDADKLILSDFPESVLDDDELACLAIEIHESNFDLCSERIKLDPVMTAYRDLAFADHNVKPFDPSELPTQDLRDAYTIASAFHGGETRSREFREEFVLMCRTVIRERQASSGHPSSARHNTFHSFDKRGLDYSYPENRARVRSQKPKTKNQKPKTAN